MTVTSPVCIMQGEGSTSSLSGDTKSKSPRFGRMIDRIQSCSRPTHLASLLRPKRSFETCWFLILSPVHNWRGRPSDSCTFAVHARLMGSSSVRPLPLWSFVVGMRRSYEFVMCRMPIGTIAPRSIPNGMHLKLNCIAGRSPAFVRVTCLVAAFQRLFLPRLHSCRAAWLPESSLKPTSIHLKLALAVD